MRHPRGEPRAAAPGGAGRAVAVRDGVRLTLREQAGERVAVAEPAGSPPSAQVVCVHGLSDHLGRQLRLLRGLAGRGYRAIGFELAGHGGRASAWNLSGWVYDAYLASDDPTATRVMLEHGTRRFAGTTRGLAAQQYDALKRAHVGDHLAQIDRVLVSTARHDPSLPIVLLGHSMGGLLSLETAWRWRHRPDAPRGLVLTSPALRPQGRPGNAVEGLAIDALWGLRRARFSLARAAVKAALDLNPPLDTAWGNPWISDLEEEVALFGADPLVPAKIPARYVSSIESRMVLTGERGFRLPVPGLMLLPERDGITSVRAGVEFARSVQAAVGRPRFRLESFGGLCAHDLVRSSRGEAALARIGDWLAELLATGAGSGAGPGGIRLSA